MPSKYWALMMHCKNLNLIWVALFLLLMLLCCSWCSCNEFSNQLLIFQLFFFIFEVNIYFPNVLMNPWHDSCLNLLNPPSSLSPTGQSRAICSQVLLKSSQKKEQNRINTWEKDFFINEFKTNTNAVGNTYIYTEIIS